jgi:hypothetical protein
LSYISIIHAVRNPHLQRRVVAAAMKEAWVNPDFGNTVYGEQMKRNPPGESIMYFMWPVAVANEADYEYALNVGIENEVPENTLEKHLGTDQGVVSDADILDAIQSNWPNMEGDAAMTGGSAQLGIAY